MSNNIKNLGFRYVLWALVLAVMLFIFSHSAKNAEQSSKTSGEVVKTVLSVVVKDFNALPEAEQQKAVDSLQFIARKSAHFSVYSALGFLCFLAMNTYSVKLKTKFFSALTISLLYAISDEIHQLFVPGRAGQIRDVFIDFSGALVGTLLAWGLVVITVKIMRKKGITNENQRTC